MQVVILAGGMGTRMGSDIPKPMIKIGGQPILWHIMKHYAVYGYTDFIVCLGYRGSVIQKYFTNHSNSEESWNVRLVETGETTGTGGRIKKVQNLISGEYFLATYGDSLSDVPIDRVIEHHLKMGLPATASVMYRAHRFGRVEVEGGRVTSFVEKPKEWINGGFYVFQPDIFNCLDDGESLEYDVLPHLVRLGQLAAYEHPGCHRAMDTPEDVKALNEEWGTGRAAWRTW